MLAKIQMILIIVVDISDFVSHFAFCTRTYYIASSIPKTGEIDAR